MSKPVMSWKTTTYARVDKLEEALYSYLTQMEGENTEMVIVNDCPFQKLVFDHPRVRIINLDKTFPVIGEKENFAVNECKGETIITGDDDDIALSNHLLNIKEYFAQHIEYYGVANLLHWERGVYYNEGGESKIGSLGNSGIVYTKAAIDRIGGYPIENAGADQTLTHRLHALDNGKGVIRASPKNISWFYRWGSTHNPDRGEVGIYHLSGQGTDDEKRPSIVERHVAHIEGLRKRKEIPSGTIQLRPRWKKDYPSILKNLLKNAN